MLSKPQYGWSTVSIKDFQAHASDMYDLPFAWLRSCICGLKYNTPVSLYVEGEDKNCIIVAYDYVTHIIMEDESVNYSLKTIEDIDVLDITHMLLIDLQAYFEDWVKWCIFEDKDADFIRRRKELKQLIDQADGYLQRAAKQRNKAF